MASKKTKQNKVTTPKVEKETIVETPVVEKEIVEEMETKVETVEQNETVTEELVETSVIEEEKEVKQEDTVTELPKEEKTPTPTELSKPLDKISKVEDLNEIAAKEAKKTVTPKKPQPRRKTMREVYGYDWNGQIFDM